MANENNTGVEFSPNEAEVVNWFRDHAIILKSVSPQTEQSDLVPLKAIIGSSQVVGLGEATHGNKEFFQMKHRLIKFLVEDLDFDTVVMECPEERAKSIDQYIKGDLSNNVLDGLTYEVWRTQEVLDLINWLKEHNEKSKKKVSFIGCDVNDQTGMSTLERDQRMADNVVQVLEKNPNSQIALWAHNGHVSYADAPQFRALGRNLKDKLGDKYISFGMLSNEGAFNARIGNFDTKVFEQDRSQVTLRPAPSETYEHLFFQTGIPLAFVDLRTARSGELFSSWRENPYSVREVGWAYDPKHEEAFLNNADLAKAFDGVVFIDKVTPSSLIN